ncbi:MAG: amino acid ABC transporter permease [Oscillospiraceae bacterium]|nr:amino acid ABC transporter permease [Oscillospiraceae bacterium]
MGNINLQELMPAMLSGTVTSLNIFFLTLLISLPLGLLIAAGRMSRLKIIRYPVQVYLLIMRGTPLMLQLFFFYFGPYYILGISGTSRFTMAIVAFGLNYTAYFAEIYRGGMEGIPLGQHEAAAALGFTKNQTFLKIVLPQVIKRIIPPMGNEFMTLVKDTALARVIAVSELFDVAAKAASGSVSTAPFIVAAVFYLIMNAAVGQAFSFAERKLDYYR